MKTLVLAAAWFAGVASAFAAPSLNGLWDATVSAGPDHSLSFPIEFSTSGGQVTGSFFNGDLRVSSTGGTFDGGKLHLDFAQYGAALDATLENGVLKGSYGGLRGAASPLEAHPHVAVADSGTAPNIAGVWTIPHDSPKGEKAWRFIVRQNGSEVSAAILRVDGDTGTLRGTWRNGRFELSLFDGTRASTLEITPQADSSLVLVLGGLRGAGSTLTAVRADVALAKGLPQPTDAALNTRMKNPAEPFRFSFPDLSGKVISNTDDQFRGKVVIVTISGSWCPNCHDEAPFLEALYKKYHSRGLEVVAIDFEDAAQLKSLTRLSAFIKKYGIDYTVVLGGETKDVHEKITQADNLNSWPTAFYLGRDGRVRAIHSGYAAEASGDFHTALVRDINGTLETLLAESAPASPPSAGN